MRYIILVLAIPFFASCGTLCTAIDDGKGCPKLAPYSGTRASAQGHSTQLDVPLSFIADTLLLPITIPKMLLDSQHPDKSPDSSSQTQQKPSEPSQ